MATRREIREAQRIIYAGDRVRKLQTELRSIEVLMNFDAGTAIPPNDSRIQPGAGPTWFIPATGRVNTSVKEAAERCDRVAKLLRKSREELRRADINRADKESLRDGLKHLATAWERRGETWRDTDRPDPRKAAERVVSKERQAFREFKRAKEYFQ